MIIIGVLSTIFGKGKGKGTKTQAKSKTSLPNSFEEIRTIVQKQFENYTPQSTRSIISENNDAQPYQQEEIVMDYLQEEEDNRAKSMEVPPPEYIENYQRKMDKIQEPVAEEVKIEGSFFSENPDAKTLINGIIWSEILGEPRSKKSHFARKR
jgi:hypothetical protein